VSASHPAGWTVTVRRADRARPFMAERMSSRMAAELRAAQISLGMSGDPGRYVVEVQPAGGDVAQLRAAEEDRAAHRATVLADALQPLPLDEGDVRLLREVGAMLSAAAAAQLGTLIRRARDLDREASR